MNTKLFLSIATCLLIVSCSSKEKNDLGKENLKGKVKSIQTLTFEGSVKFGQVEKGNPSRFGEYKTFNENGYTTKIAQPPFSSLSEYNVTWSFIYDEKGRLKEKIFDDSSYIVHSKTMYEYNEKGLLEKINKYASTGESLKIELYKHDTKNNPIEITTKTIGMEMNSLITGKPEINWVNWKDEVKTFKYEYSNSKITKSIETQTGGNDYSITRIYDKKSNLLEEKKIIQITDSLDNPKEVVSEENVYTYENYQLIKGVNIIRYPNQKEITKTYKYDSKGNMIQVYEVNSDGTELYYDYEYDHHNNWIKEIITAPKYSTIAICREREINYYGETEKNEFPALVESIRKQKEFEENCTIAAAESNIRYYMKLNYPDWKICTPITITKIGLYGECKFNAQFKVINPHYSSYIIDKEQIVMELTFTDDFQKFSLEKLRGTLY